MSAPDELRALLGPAGYLDAPGDLAPVLADPINGGEGDALALLRPASAQAAARAVAICAKAGLPITPRGGGSGFAGGAVPCGGVVIDLCRMRAVRHLDRMGGTVTVEAGLPLAALDEALEPHGLMLPVRHGGIGSATVGGTIATNAGGSNVLAHGMARAQVLGLEVVLADGRLWSGLSALLKDNTGPDLRELMIGSEGILGLITAATLRLSPRPGALATALVAVDSPEAALTLFAQLRGALGPLLATCELMSRQALVAPAPLGTPWLVLAEIETPAAVDAEALLAEVLLPLPKGAPDALLAQSLGQRRQFWALREGLAEAMARDPLVLKSDTAVPVAAVPAFIEDASAAVAAVLPGVTPVPFGHLGDGNIHFNLRAPEGTAPADFAGHRPALVAAIARASLELGGTISAEHGIGRTKRAALAAAKPVEAGLIGRIKAALDPQGIFNPGKVVD